MKLVMFIIGALCALLVIFLVYGTPLQVIDLIFRRAI